MNRIYYFALLLMASLLFNTAMADEQEKDAETMRFEAEIRSRSQMMRYPFTENIIASQVEIFQASAPASRQAIWTELEKTKLQQVEHQQQEIADAQSLRDMPTDEFDAETLRYKAAIEQMNLPPAAIEDLVKMFQANEAPMRELLMQYAQAYTNDSN
jgi:hypothetical protein